MENKYKDRFCQAMLLFDIQKFDTIIYHVLDLAVGPLTAFFAVASPAQALKIIYIPAGTALRYRLYVVGFQKEIIS